jgi:CRP-like cAMP-binding protein
MMDKVNSASAVKTALSSVPYFAGLDETVLAAIGEGMTLRHYNEGEIVFLEGEACEGMYLVQSGLLKGVIGRQE